MKKRIFILLGSVLILFLLSGGLFLLFNKGFLRFNYPSLTEFPIQGIDVSNHQHEIDWKAIDKHKIRFAFIKATEGADFKDKSFNRNWEQAKQSGIVVGAYHFFTFCKSPEEQAQNFIETVPDEPGTLPPAIDLEYSGNCKLTKSKDDLLCDIETFIQIVEEHYQRRMVIYVTEQFYADILKGQFLDNFFWVRDIYMHPHTSDNRLWTFWQFANKGKLKGIDTFVDMNVFRGTQGEFENLLLLEF